MTASKAIIAKHSVLVNKDRYAVVSASGTPRSTQLGGKEQAATNMQDPAP